MLIAASSTALLALALIACGGSAVRPESESTLVDELSDAATIWCDENRWQVVRRAVDLQLALPLETNPSEEELVAGFQEQIENVERDVDLGRVDPEEAVEIFGDINEQIEASMHRFETGEWHVAGVRDTIWTSYISENPVAYARACQAAFDLR